MPERRALLLYAHGALGLGHLVRSLALARALNHAFRVVLLYGGRVPADVEVPAGIELVALPALPAGTGVARAIVEVERRRLIVETVGRLRPRVVVTELFPFGRRKLEREVIALLTEARRVGTPVVVSSVRDVLIQGRRDQQAFDDWASATANRWFDHVLVHSDPGVARFEDSFAPRVPLRIPVHHTGFVHDGVTAAAAYPHPGIVVSAGGGAAGGSLLETAVESHRLLPRGTVMTVVAGPFAGEWEWRALVRLAGMCGPGLRLLRSVPRLCPLLRSAHASISQCGYNTSLDLLATAVPALVVPFVAPGEDEQARRAHRLAELRAVRVLDPRLLTPGRLASEIAALERFRPRRVDVELDGALQTVALLARLAACGNEALAS